MPTDADVQEFMDYQEAKKARNKKIPVARATPTQPDDPEKVYVHQEYPKVKYGKVTKERPAALVINPIFQRDQPEGPANTRFLPPAKYIETIVKSQEEEDALIGEWFDTPDLKKKEKAA